MCVLTTGASLLRVWSLQDLVKSLLQAGCILGKCELPSMCTTYYLRYIWGLSKFFLCLMLIGSLYKVINHLKLPCSNIPRII